MALMRLVVEGRGAPGALRASPSSPGFLMPNARLLHLRSTVMLEVRAAWARAVCGLQCMCS